MTLQEYLRTKEYLSRLIATRDSQRKSLEGKKFAQFSNSFDFEIEKLNDQLAAFHGTLANAINIGCVAYKSFHRIVPNQAILNSTITLCGSLKNYAVELEPTFTEKSSLLVQDPWNNPSECLREAAA